MLSHANKGEGQSHFDNRKVTELRDVGWCEFACDFAHIALTCLALESE